MTSDGVRTFGYTAENILHTVNGGAALAHDALGRLYYTSEPISFAYDGSNMIAELQYVGGHPIVRRYVHGPGVDEPLVWYEGSGTSDRRFLHADERGSIVAVSDSAGNVTGVNKYDEYGVPQGPSGAGTLLGRFGYTGQTWLPELGLYYYKARMYHPKLGRFMQADPIGYGDGMNWYNYVGSDPVNLTDPSGKCFRENWSMHIYDAKGNDLGSDPVNPESWSVLVGCDKFSTPRLQPWQVHSGEGGDSQSLIQQIAQRYRGNSFCPNATVGNANRFNPFGRINSGKVGGFDTALADLDRITFVNGLSQLGDVIVNFFSISLATQFLIPTHLGDGWWVSKSYWSGDTTISNKGYTFRYNAESGKINIDIPSGANLPNGGSLSQNETCHYRR